MKPTLVILAVGLSPAMVGKSTPNLQRLVARGASRSLASITPAVTCSVQSTLLTGLMPADHGIVANGWYFRDLAEVWFWRQSNHLVAGEKLWDAAKARDPTFTCAQMFWWYNMYANVDWSATPRPQYPADGRKIPDHYTAPAELHDELDAKLGRFPLFKFWGPLTDITATEWIAEATLHTLRTRNPTLTLTYLPHLDYNLQRLGPDLGDARLQEDLGALDAVCGRLIDEAAANRREVIVVSEYGITPVRGAIAINRELRQAGLVKVRPEEFGREVLDPGASIAFAAADHQIAHVYVRDPARINTVRALLERIDGVETVLDEQGKRAVGLDHPRAGELVAISAADRWFSYYYWLDERLAPDFARTVDIHRKPGYDPVELFVDPEIRFPKLATGWRLGKRKLGQRSLLDVISSSATSLVKGSHGRLTDDPADGPLVISSRADLMPAGPVQATRFKQLVLDHLFS